MKAIIVEISRYISNEPQPGIVECKLIDANKQEWIFIEKTAIVTSQRLDKYSYYPQLGTIACEIIEIGQNENGDKIAKVDTSIPWSIAAKTGESMFEVLFTQLTDE